MCELVSVQGSAPFWERFGFERVAEFEYAPGARRQTKMTKEEFHEHSGDGRYWDGRVGGGERAGRERGRRPRSHARSGKAEGREGDHARSRGTSWSRRRCAASSTASRAYSCSTRSARPKASEALMAVTAMRVAGVKRVVYISVHDVEKAAWLPHFGGKVGDGGGAEGVRDPVHHSPAEQLLPERLLVQGRAAAVRRLPAAARRQSVCRGSTCATSPKPPRSR